MKPKTLAEMEDKFYSYEGADRVISSHEMKDLVDAEPDNPVKFNSGFPAFDRLTKGFEGGELIIISGPTKHGKTSLAQTMTANIAKNNIDSLWFSYEMPPRQFLKKFRDLPTFFLPAQLLSKDLLWIENRIFEAKLKYNIQAVFIDHLHFLVDMEQVRNPSLEIGSIVRKVKKLAMKHNLVIFLLAHMKKVRLEMGKEPDVDDLRDSSFIAQDSDSVMMVLRECEMLAGEKIYGNKTRLYIQTHRREGVMGKRINLIYENYEFRELDSNSPEGVAKDNRLDWIR